MANRINTPLEMKQVIDQWKETQKTFIAIEDWNEVSKMQFDIDELQKTYNEKFGNVKLVQFENWFIILWNNYQLKLMTADINKFKYLEKLKEQTCRKCRNKNECDTCPINKGV